MAKKKTPKFLGRIVHSAFDFGAAASDVIGPHHVMYPTSNADVARAVKLSQDVMTFVRSGTQVAKGDLVNGTGGIVINMMELAKVSIEGVTSLKAEAAATTESVAAHLAAHHLALPLADNPRKSIISNVLKDTPSYLMRSLGPLSDYVAKIRAVNRNGKSVTIRDRPGASCVQQCLDSRVYITEVEFKATPAEDLWMYRVTFPYPGQEQYLEIASALFVKKKFSKEKGLERCDLVVDTFNGRHQIPLVSITALGSSTKGKNKLKKRIREALGFVRGKYDEDDILEETFSRSEVLVAIADAGLGAALDPTIDSEKHHDGVGADEDLDEFLEEHATKVHRGIAFGAKGVGKIEADRHLTSCLQVNRENGLVVTGHAHTPAIEEAFAAPLLPAVAGAIGTTTGAVDAAKSEAAALPFGLTASTGPIPGFVGDVYRRGDRGYESRIKQYATSSYPKAKMTPYMVAYPRNEKDISLAIAFAQKGDKKIVARSGGHSYSGCSSGGKDTIVLSMDNFDRLDFSSGNIAEVGPAVRLTKLAKRFKKRGVTIPHGECATVAIGGHAQTGGYGHLLRSFGLALDRVESFDIVLANGKKRTVSRPQLGSSPTTPDEEIFWGVLGGNAGSFGVVTHYKFSCIKDSEHPDSYGFSAVRKYRSTLFKKLMKEVQAWTIAIENRTLPDGIDFMMTVESAGRSPIPILLAEGVQVKRGNKQHPVAGDKEIQSMLKAASSGAKWWERLLTHYGKKKLSKLSNSFVRNWPVTTLDGREFKYPYKKRINCTMNALSNVFINRFVDKVTHVVKNERDVKLVFQMGLGGGAYQNSNRRPGTSIPHRDYVFCFVFDIFYKKNGKAKAEQLQKEMQQLVDDQFSPTQELRVFWGTFGDIDIEDPAVEQMYYNDTAKYALLQQLKRRVDSKDVFHTQISVKP